uniref:Uncharacterized protein n=1 Tax=Vertebrata thuyoides TaxID=2006970 RepID=A0A1Z1MAE8_9FLOR|nr:hypothetical protein [Vertebrata thuyoides]ARW63058.1 hypothetical protein [Vertebrata thuyoides]
MLLDKKFTELKIIKNIFLIISIINFENVRIFLDCEYLHF